MSNSVVDLAEQAPAGAGLTASLGARVARRLVLRKLEALDVGALHLIEEGEHFTFGVAGAPLSVTVRVHDPRFYPKVATGGSIGAAEAYMAGYWTADDLTGVVRLLVRNRALLDNLEAGWARLAAPFYQLFHALRSNTRRGSRRNIEAHYDLGDDFFRLFLDETMMYSCAIFDPPTATLAEASRAKIERLCRKLALRPEDHVLEIGSGWGGFALHAARNYGCRVTTVTVSSAQHCKVVSEVAAAGLAGRVEVRLEDYRDVRGRYDKLVCIEMLEAVGHSFFDTFFRVCSNCLAPRGLMALQTITIADRYYEQARRSVDFIQRYIFPGGAIPSISAISASVARFTDLTPVHLEDIGPHYARTLRAWRRRFLAAHDAVRELGFSERFIRMWEFYFCYCEGGFLERSIIDIQLVLAKPSCRRTPLLGALED